MNTTTHAERSQPMRDQLRSQLKCARAALSAEHTQRFSSAICKRAMALLRDAHRIGGYLAHGAEVDLNDVASNLTVNNRQYYVPVIRKQQQMQFAPIDGSTPIQLNKYGISEPVVKPESLISGMQLDAVLVPLVGFDERCNRIGMGGGYYDRCFEQRKVNAAPPTLIGVAYECQHAETVFAENWDVALDFIVTENRLICNDQ